VINASNSTARREMALVGPRSDPSTRRATTFIVPGRWCELATGPETWSRAHSEQINTRGGSVCARQCIWRLPRRLSSTCRRESS
jgi:hypothetical protein